MYGSVTPTTSARTDCCVAAPAILEFDPEGNLYNAWGTPDYNPGWPAFAVARPGPSGEHAIAVDKDGNVWLTGQSRGDGLQKYSRDGKLLWDFGHRGPRPVPGQPPPPIVENNQGRMAGQFHWLDGIAMDSLGNIYTGEVDDGKRVQKFVLLNGDGVRRFRPHD